MNMIIEFIRKKFAKEPQEKKTSLQDKAKHLLVGFFVMMLMLTIISRAADSVTVARVQATNTKSGVLNFKVSGNGTINAVSEKYIDLYEGIKIKSIVVKEGQTVKEGDLLFCYDFGELEAAKEKLQTEYTIALLNQKKGELSLDADTSADQAKEAGITLKRARYDLEKAKEELEAAKNDINKEKQDGMETAASDYSDSKAAWEEMKEDQEWELEKLQKKKQKAQEAFDKLYEEKEKVQAVLASYEDTVKNSTVSVEKTDLNNSKTSTGVEAVNSIYFSNAELDNTYISLDKSYQTMLNELFNHQEAAVSENTAEVLGIAKKNILKQYYGEKAYESHEEEVQAARQTLARAKQDYMLTFIDSAETGGYVTTSQKAVCIRAYQDALTMLKKVTKKDMELYDAMNAYGAALQGGNETDMADSCETLFVLLYHEDEKKQEEIAAAKELLVTTQEEIDQSALEWERKLNKAERELTKSEEIYKEAQKACMQIENQSYDYTKEVRSLQNQVDNAQRSVEDAQNTIEKAKQSDVATLTINQNTKEKNQIDKKINDLEIQEKKEAVNKVDELLRQKGKVCSPFSGVLLQCGLEVGTRTTGAEKVSISTDQYSFQAKVAKADAKHLAIGDEITIAPDNARKNISSVIETIGVEDTQGMVELTAALPEDEYGAGAAASFTASKISKRYSQIIPLQALRMDANQTYYILVIQESNTILGNELTAVKVNVSLEEKDEESAAVEAIDTGDIIVSSNKSIKEGDRVRINENSN